MAIPQTVEASDITVRVPTLDSSLSTYTGLLVKWIDPNGNTGEATASVYSTSYLEINIDEDDLIYGEWYFWGEAITPGGDVRHTKATRLRVLREGEEG